MSKKKNKKQIVEGKPVQELKKKKNSRTKGHSFERDLVLIFKSLGFEHCKTSRYANRLLDDCKVDLCHIPLNLQSKIGYWNNRPKPEVIFKEMKAHIDSNFPPGNSQRDYPKVLFHFLDKREDEHQLVIMMYKDWVEMFKKSLKNG